MPDVIAVLLLVCSVAAQTDAPAFEVASIKPNRSASGNTSVNTSKGRIVMENVSLKQLIEQAYKVRDFSLTGPSWLESEHFDISAKIPEGSKHELVPAMLQALLIERFKLSVHREPKTLTGFALVPAKSGAKVERAAEGGHAGVGTSINNGHGKMTLTGSTMSTFADNLSLQLNQPVQDITGLTGMFDLTLTWGQDTAIDSGPTIFTAVQEQLGLQLRAQKVTIDIVIVDSIEKVPTEN